MAIREFIPIGLKASDIDDKLRFEGPLRSAIIMSLKPMLYGFWSSSSGVESKQLEFFSQGVNLGRITGEVKEAISLGADHFTIWSPKETELTVLNLKQRYWELSKILRQSRKGKFHFNRREVTHLSAAYYCPRKIYVVVVATEDYLNIFPMDLHLKNPESNAYALGLQVTNLATAKIEESQQLLVCELDTTQLSTAYSLGKNHGKTNLHGAKLPYEFSPSHHYGLPVPDFAIGYREIQIEQSKHLGSHMLFLGRVVNEVLPDQAVVQPYHIHRFYYDWLSRKGLLSPSMKLKVS